MKAVLVNYNYDPIWLRDYPELEVTMYDRSDDGIERNLEQYGDIIKTPNIGNVDYDRLGWLVENYYNLPDVFLWSKSNLFKYISKEEFDFVKSRKEFTPLLTQDHTPRKDHKGVLSFYEDGMYHERADTHLYGSWVGHRTWREWAQFFHLPTEEYVPFAPGGNYVLTREAVHKQPQILYHTMRMMLPYSTLPGEAHLCERSYYLLWK